MKIYENEPQSELFIQTFGTPQYHPKSQPFVDHVFTFSIMDGKIWFRNYQIAEENGELVEIGILNYSCKKKEINYYVVSIV